MSNRGLTDYPDKQSELAEVFEKLKGASPDEAAGILKTAAKVGVDPNRVAQNPDWYGSYATDDVDYHAFQKRAPLTTEVLLSSPLYAATAKSNLEFYARTEDAFKPWRAIKEGTKGVASATLSSLRSWYELGANSDTDSEATMEWASPDTYGMRKDKKAVPVEATFLKNLIQSEYLAPKPVVAQTTLGQYGLDVLQMVPQIAAQVVMGALTGGVGSAVFMGTQIQGGAYEKLRGEGVDIQRAMAASVTNALLQTPLESIGFNKAMKAFKPSTARAYKARELFERTFTESFTEFLQQYPDAATELWAKNPGKSVSDLAGMMWNDIGEITKEGLYQGIVAAPFGFLGGAVQLRVKQAVATNLVQRIEKMQNDVAIKSALSDSPETLIAMADTLSGNQKIHIDPEAIIALYQSDSFLSQEEIDGLLGVNREQVEKAQQEGELIEIPLGKYVAATVENPEVHTHLKEDIATETDGQTLRHMKLAEKDINLASEEVKAQRTEIKAESAKLIEMFVNAGTTKGQAQSIAQLIVLNAHTRSKNPAQYIREKGLRIVRNTDRGVPVATPVSPQESAQIQAQIVAEEQSIQTQPENQNTASSKETVMSPNKKAWLDAYDPNKTVPDPVNPALLYADETNPAYEHLMKGYWKGNELAETPEQFYDRVYGEKITARLQNPYNEHAVETFEYMYPHEDGVNAYWIQPETRIVVVAPMPAQHSLYQLTKAVRDYSERQGFLSPRSNTIFGFLDKLKALDATVKKLVSSQMATADEMDSYFADNEEATANFESVVATVNKQAKKKLVALDASGNISASSYQKVLNYKEELIIKIANLTAKIEATKGEGSSKINAPLRAERAEHASLVKSINKIKPNPLRLKYSETVELVNKHTGSSLVAYDTDGSVFPETIAKLFTVKQELLDRVKKISKQLKSETDVAEITKLSEEVTISKEIANKIGGFVAGHARMNVFEINKAMQSSEDVRAEINTLMEEISNTFDGALLINADGTLHTTGIETRMATKKDGTVNQYKPKFGGFARSLTQTFIDHLPLADFELIRGEIVQGIEHAYANGGDGIPDVKFFNLTIAESSNSDWNIAPALGDAEKTGAALNLSSYCPMFMIGSHGCYLDGCYVTGMGMGGNTINLYHRAMYTGEILQLSQSEIDMMNSIGGLRVNGQGDISFSQYGQFRDFVRHAAMRGLQLKIITKQDTTMEMLDRMSRDFTEVIGGETVTTKGIDINHVMVQLSIDPYWIPISEDELAGSIAQRMNLSKGFENGIKNDADPEDLATVIADIYKQSGREAKLIDGKMYRKYGYSIEKAEEMIAKFPAIKVLPRVVVGTVDEIIHFSVNHPTYLQTWMHASIRGGMYSDVPMTVRDKDGKAVLDDNGNPVTRNHMEKGDIGNFTARIAVIKNADGKWVVRAQENATNPEFSTTIMKMTRDMESETDPAKKYELRKKIDDQYNKAAEDVDTITRGAYQRVEDAIYEGRTDREADQIFSQLAGQLRQDPSSLCCSAGADKNACFNCRSNCHIGAFSMKDRAVNASDIEYIARTVFETNRSIREQMAKTATKSEVAELNQTSPSLNQTSANPNVIAERMLESVVSETENDAEPKGFAFLKPGEEPKVVKTVYKLMQIKKSHPDNLFFKYVDNNVPVPIGEWIRALPGEKSKDGKGVKSKLGKLAFRPGFHSGEYPQAQHIGEIITPGAKTPTHRREDEVWAEVEIGMDIDYQSRASESKTRDLKEVPVGGTYQFNTSGNVEGTWFISGEMKIKRVLSDEEVMEKNKETGVNDLPRNVPRMFQEKDIIKASFSWAQGRPVITLFGDAADASSLIHETVGHYFMYNLLEDGAKEDAADWLKKDRATVLNWVGIPEAEWASLWALANQSIAIGKDANGNTITEWNLSDSELANSTERKEVRNAILRVRTAHETMAKGAESYFYKGVAPTVETRGVFQRFKEWMLGTYKRADEIGVDIPPEIRDVFSRMIATQEQIDRTEALGEYHKMLPEIVLRNLTDRQKNEMDKWLLMAKQRAEDILRGEVMQELRDTYQKEKASLEEQYTKEITEAVSLEPFYFLCDNIAKDFAKDGVPRDAKRVAEDYLNMKLPPDQELHFDSLAEAFKKELGVSSGMHLAEMIRQNPTKEKEIQSRVKAEMQAWRDIFTSPEAMEEAAKVAMYNDNGLRFLAIETQVLNDILDKTLSAEERRNRAEQIRQGAVTSAKQIMGSRPIEEATQTARYMANERRLAVKADQLLRAGKVAEAAEMKVNQLLAHAMTMESIRIRKEAERIEKYLKKQQGLPKVVQGKGSSWKKEEYFVQAAAILGRFGFPHKDYDPAKKVDALKTFVDKINEDLDAMNIAEWLYKETTTGSRKTLTISQYKDVENSIRNIKRVANMERKMFTIWGEAYLDAIIGKVKELTVHLNDKAGKIEPESSKYSTARGYLYALKKFTTVVNELDRYKDFGWFYQVFYDPVYRAQNKLSMVMEGLKVRLDESYNKFSKEEWKDLLANKFYPELNDTTSRFRIIQMAMHVGNESSRKVLFSYAPVGFESSGMWVQDDFEGNEKRVMEFLGKNISAKEWNYVQETWNTVNSLWGIANDTHKMMTGFSMEKVEALPFAVKLQDGTTLNMDGGYFPLREDKRVSTKPNANAEGENPLHTERGILWNPKTRTGYTLERTGATYPVSLEFSNVYSHLSAVAHDAVFRPVITDLRRVVQNEEFAATMRKKIGQEGYNSFLDFVANAANTSTRASAIGGKWLDDIAQVVRKNTIVASLMFRIPTVVQNLANPFLYGNAIEGWSHVDSFSAWMQYGIMSGDFLTVREDVLKLSSFMRDTSKNPDFLFTEFTVDGKQSMWMQFGGMMLAESDNITKIPMWWGCYQQSLTNGMTEYEAIRRADTLVDRTTGSGRKIDTAQVLRGSAVERLLTMFGTFMNTQFNAWSRETGIVIETKDYARLLSFVGIRYLAFAYTSALLTGAGGDDERDKDKYLAKWATELLKYPIRTLPMFGDLAVVAGEKLAGVNSFGYKLSPVETHLNNIHKAWGSAGKLMSGKGTTADFMESITTAASFVVPYPDQLNDLFWNGYNLMNGDMQFKMMDLAKRRPLKERR